MSKSNDAKRLHGLAIELLTSVNGNIATATQKLADTIVKDHALATAMAAGASKAISLAMSP